MIGFLLLIAFLCLGWYMGTGIFDALFGKPEKDLWSSSDQKTVFNDFSKHTHFHVHSDKKSKEIKKLTDTLENDTIDVEYKDVK